MKFDRLLKTDENLTLIYPNNWKKEILGITTMNFPKKDKIFFLNDYKFYKYWLEGLESNKDKWKNSGVIISNKLWKEEEVNKKIKEEIGFVLLSDNSDLSICILSKLFYDEKFADNNDIDDGRDTGTAKIHSSVKISKNVFIGKDVEIEAGVIIHSGCNILSKSIIRKNTVLFPNVTVYQGVIIGENCRLHSGVVIGADGFGYKNINGVHIKIWHTGGVIIENNVEIGALSSIDYGTFIPTRIGEGSIIDNQVQIGHNCQIGKGVVLCGQSGVSGSGNVGDYTVVGGKAGIGNDLTVGKNSQVAGNAMVNTSWPENSILGGHPARPLREWLRGLAFVRKQVKMKDNLKKK